MLRGFLVKGLATKSLCSGNETLSLSEVAIGGSRSNFYCSFFSWLLFL